MPPKKSDKGGLNFDNIFLPYILAVEQKINQIERFLADHEEDTHIGDFTIKILVAYADTLRVQMVRMECDWDDCRADVPNIDYNRIKKFVDDSMAALMAALEKAEGMVCQSETRQRAGGTKSEDPNSTNTSQGATPGKLGAKLDNTLRPADKLSRNMTLEEASKWMKNFEELPRMESAGRRQKEY